MSTASSPVFQSRWGFHPVSYQDFLKMKQINKNYYYLIRLYLKSHRWHRKHPLNRYGPEPPDLSKYDPIFRSLGGNPLFYINYQRFLSEYRNARHSVDHPELVVPIDLSKWQILAEI